MNMTWSKGAVPPRDKVTPAEGAFSEYVLADVAPTVLKIMGIEQPH